MGGGKKKGSKQKSETTETSEQLSNLQLGETSVALQKSTEPPPPAVAPEDEEGGLGLGLGGGKKKNKPKKKSNQKSSTTSLEPKDPQKDESKGSGEPSNTRPIPGQAGQIEAMPAPPEHTRPIQGPGYAGPKPVQSGMMQVPPGLPGTLTPEQWGAMRGHPGHMGPTPGHPGHMGPNPGQPGHMGPIQGHPGHTRPMPGHPSHLGPTPGQQRHMGPMPGQPGQMGPMPGQPVQMGPMPGQPGQMGSIPVQPGYMESMPGQQGYMGPMPGQPPHMGQLTGEPPHMGQIPEHPSYMGPMPGHPSHMGPMPGQIRHMGPMPGQPGQMGPMPGQPGQMESMPGQQGYMGPMPGQAPHMGPMPEQPGQMEPMPDPMVSDPQDPTPGEGQKKTRGRGKKGKDKTSEGSMQPDQQRPTQSAPATTPASTQSVAKDSTPTKQTISRFKIPAKIVGTSVKMLPCPVLTNYLPMTIKAMKIYRYDVAIVPDKPKKFLGRIFQLAIKKKFPNHIAAYDQMKNCYCVKPFPEVSQTSRVTDKVEIKDDNGKAMSFEVSFKSTGVVDLGTILEYMKDGTSLNPPTEAIQCIDVVLRQGTLESYVKAGRQFFKRPSNPVDLGDGMEMWTGLFQSAIFTSRAFVNIDVAHKGFPINQPLINLVTSMQLDPRRSLKEQPGRNLDNFKAFLKGLRVTAYVGGGQGKTATKREFICNDIAETPNMITFDFNDPSGNTRKMTVADYFAKEKGIRLKYPNLNCIWVGPKDKKIYYPLELLDVSYGQVRNRQLNEIQLSKMIREAATPPDIRKKKIHEVIRSMNYSKNNFFKAFGLDITDEFTPVQGKLIAPPKLDCGSRTPSIPARGVWKSDRVLEGSKLLSWGIIGVELDPSRANAEEIVKIFRSVGPQMGITVEAPCMSEFNIRSHQLEGVMRNALSRQLQLLLVVINTRSREQLYSQVKKMAERQVGVLTQCLKDQTAQRKMNGQTARNILLKVNSKLMGVNQALSNETLPFCLRQGPYMVVGADVTHPSPDQSNVPSIAAVTASIDKKCFKYNIEFSIQTPKKEMIVEFEDMMVDHFMLFKKALNCLPKKIYVFRDGVSEGQFAEVMNSELQAVYNAFSRVSGTPQKPEVLFMLVQKRHHTRFFSPKNSYNVEPGTVVDKDIVHPRELDFYLVSHHAIQGTARPTRYHAVCNDGGWKDDEVEQLTYYLCHLYSRCTRSVSYPTPTYYAHLACMRARALTMNETFDNNQLERKPVRLHIKDRLHEMSPMFFV